MQVFLIWQKKRDDKDAKNIERRLMSVSNLVAVSAKYHKN